MNLLNDEIQIYKDSNAKFIEENEILKIENSKFKNQISIIEKEIETQKQKNAQNKIDKDELEFLRMNLLYSHKCRKTVFNEGFKIGTEEYKNCILRKGNN